MKSLLLEIINSPHLLEKGGDILERELQKHQSRKALLEAFAECQNRNFIVLTQNVYPLVWPTLSEEEKVYTRHTLLRIFYESYNQARDIEALGIFISKIHNIEGYTEWAHLYQELFKTGLTEPLMELMLVIYRLSDDRISTINSALIQQVIASTQNPNITQQTTEKLLILLYCIVKSTAMLEGTNDTLLRSIIGGDTSKWLLAVYQRVLSSPEVHLHKIILQQLTLLFADAPRYSFSTFHQIINSLWLYINNLVPVYLKENVLSCGVDKGRFLEEEYIQSRFEESTVSEGLVYQGLELLETIFTHNQTKSLMKFALYPLVSVLSNLLLITKRDEKEWMEEENKFIADTADESMIGVRSRVISFLCILAEKYEQTVPIVTMVINNSLFEGGAPLKDVFKKSIIDSQVMGKLDQKLLEKAEELQLVFDTSFVTLQVNKDLVKEAATLLLLNFVSEILETADKNTLFIKLREIVEASTYPLLKIQSLNALVRCAEEIQVAHIPNLLSYALTSLDSPYPGLRVIAVKAIGAFIRKLRMGGQSNNISMVEEQHISKIVGLVKSFTSETLHVFLDTCIELTKYNPHTQQQILRHLENMLSSLLEESLTDGMIASQLEELLGVASSTSIQHQLLVKVDQTINTPSQVEITSLCCKILERNLENQIFTYSDQGILNEFILKHLKHPEVEGLVRDLLKVCSLNSTTLSSVILNIKPSWFIPLHQRGVNLDVVPLLKHSIDNILTMASPSEVEQELVLPFYLMWNNPQETVNLIRSFGVYDQFVTKWLRYQPHFQGDILKKVSMKLSSSLQQPHYRQLVREYMSSQSQKSDWGGVKGDLEWEDQEDEDGWLCGDLVNRIVQKQLLDAIKGIDSLDVSSVFGGM